MHGGAKGSGAPKGNQNALKHGVCRNEAKALNKHITELLSEGKKMIEDY